jgi:hypothetical protein
MTMEAPLIPTRVAGRAKSAFQHLELPVPQDGIFRLSAGRIETLGVPAYLGVLAGRG